ncbi:hypothetical protein M413DRAFT_109116 [Hebeloma cylindrosporum]|uniref:Uncharacterized protein n=1 Tax=Hebeloma cylindrosporum TaxID=76867 RepID=A0A0C3CZ84_HEBCY|nr:hypothetical protein M413DRAFT_109116 [Hebeloma cylindrosporum h7]
MGSSGVSIPRSHGFGAKFAVFAYCFLILKSKGIFQTFNCPFPIEYKNPFFGSPRIYYKPLFYGHHSHFVHCPRCRRCHCARDAHKWYSRPCFSVTALFLCGSLLAAVTMT